MSAKKLALLAVMALFVSGSVAAEAVHKYVGVKKCSMCHKSEAKGNQFGQWQSTGHAKAYGTLASPEALETAKRVGLAGDPQKAPECLKCHTTGYGGEQAEGFIASEGVQCETCHGAGSDYLSLSVMKSREKSIAGGLIMPTKEVCEKCHNKDNPNYKEFNYDEAVKKITHPAKK
ncbi:MAG: cytochrome c family protein [Candidatus Omnitrophica bacterium]|nr:cytochrome c family protein [Candidatus Omnitrophota bacterium]